MRYLTISMPMTLHQSLRGSAAPDVNGYKTIVIGVISQFMSFISPWLYPCTPPQTELPAFSDHIGSHERPTSYFFFLCTSCLGENIFESTRLVPYFIIVFIANSRSPACFKQLDGMYV
jgi:hypothetical protein